MAPGEDPDEGGDGGAEVAQSSSLGVRLRLRARSSSGGGSSGAGGDGGHAASKAPEYSSAGSPATRAAARVANSLSANIGSDS